MFWNPPIKLTKTEDKIVNRTKKARKFYVFLRENRHLILNEGFERKVIETYREENGGKSPALPGQLTIAFLLQAYCNVSDKEAIELTVMDKRWQMVLNCLNCEEPPFCQATLVNFRNRLILNNLDKELLERTVSVAEEFGGFGSTQLKAVLDSSPLFGAGRVEDTFNLLGHALSKALRLSAKELKISEEEIIEQSGLLLIGKSSLKAALDLDWSEVSAKSEALNQILEELERWKVWLEKQKEITSDNPPLKEVMNLIEEIINQDTDPDPDKGGRKIKQEVSKDRRISVEDKEMRHGRKSSSKCFNGFKQHLLGDLTTKLIKEVVVRPANEPEYKAIDYFPELDPAKGLEELAIYLGYAGHPKIIEWEKQGVKIISKPWNRSKSGLFTKDDFNLDFQEMIITCPGGHEMPMVLGKQVSFPVSKCSKCQLNEKCTNSKNKRRQVEIRHDEEFQLKRRQNVKTKNGREELRKRVSIEHRISHHVASQGRKARYIGIRKNQLDGRRHAAVINLQMAQLFYDRRQIA